MLLEGGGGGFVISNVPSSAVTSNVLSGCERAYDRSFPRPPSTDQATTSSASMNDSNTASTILTTSIAASTSVTPKDNNVANAAMIEVENEKRTSSIMGGQEDGAVGCAATACSSSEETSKSIGTSGSAVTTADTEPGFPAIGSPPADLMVVNTNGFNPLQHAALRGNPG